MNFLDKITSIFTPKPTPAPTPAPTATPPPAPEPEPPAPEIPIDERSERNIATLSPEAQTKARAWYRACKAAGLPVIIIDGSRTFAQQDALYEQGRSKPGKIVTNARGGYSWHNFGDAWDFGHIEGGVYYTDGKVYDQAGAIAREQGLEWGGDWTGLVDRPHIQLKTGLTLAQKRERHLATA